jgi:hypothetical protein
LPHHPQVRASFADAHTYAMQSRFESLAVELDEVQAQCASQLATSTAFSLHPQPPAAHPSDPLPCPSSPSSSDVSDDDAPTPDAHDELLPTNLKLRGEKIVAAEPLEALETLEAKVGRLKIAVHNALLHNPGAHPGLVSTASQPVPGNEQDALSVQRVRLLETELRDKDSVLEQEKREVQKLRQEILTMDAERQMFENQLSKAEDAARAAGAAGTRFRKLEDDAIQLQKVVELLREEKEKEVSDMRRSLDYLQKAIDQQECWREPWVSSGRVSPSVEHAARQKGTSSDEVGMWSGRYMNGR